MLLLKLPLPVPLLVLVLRAIVGLGLVLQHTPRAVMAAPPSAVMLPPLFALLVVIAETEVVEMVGKTIVAVVKLT
jgi:hypothetical protein